MPPVAHSKLNKTTTAETVALSCTSQKSDTNTFFSRITTPNNQETEKATIDKSGLQSAVTNVMPMAFGSLLQVGSHHGRASQRQEPAARTAVSHSGLARAIKRITPQAHAIVVQEMSKELGYQFVLTEDETQIVNQLVTKWLQEKMLARQIHATKEEDATMKSTGDDVVNPANPTYMGRNA